MSLNIVGIQRAGQTYVLMFDDENRSAAISTAARWACDDSLSFDLRDARIVAAKVDSLPLILEDAGE